MSKGARGENRRDVVLSIACKEALTGCNLINLSSVTIQILYVYCSEWVGIIDVKRFDGIVVNGKDLVMYDLRRFVGDTALDA